MAPVLWHIQISHYSEKVRWALELKAVEHERRAPPPGAHMAVAAWVTRGRSVTFPVLRLDGRVYGDSTAIIAALERRYPDPPLYPGDPALRRRALDLEEWFDEQVGPYTRRVAFYELRREPERFDAVGAQAAPELFARIGRGAGVLARAFTGRRYNAGDASAAADAATRVEAGFDRLEEELGDDDYLVGGRFTVADLTAAAMLYPAVLPPESPTVIGELPERYERFREPLKERRGWRWVEQMFARHRHPARVAAAS